MAPFTREQCYVPLLAFRPLRLAPNLLYLITPIWTYFIMQTDAASFVGAINSVLPALMGMFTAWFQKRYSRFIARG